MENYFSKLIESHQYMNEKSKIENNIINIKENIENLN